jgi:TM2 domain-containing membrane protein YozV
MKSKNVAGLLALFFGSLGVHLFYLGRPWMGILYALFCWTLIPTILAFIQAIIYFSYNTDKFNAKYNPEYVKTETEKVNREKIVALGALNSLLQSGQISQEEYNERAKGLA